MGSNPYKDPAPVTRAEAAASAVRYAVTGGNPRVTVRDRILVTIIFVCLAIAGGVADPVVGFVAAIVAIPAVVLLEAGR